MKFSALFLAAALLFESATPAPLVPTSGLQVRDSIPHTETLIPLTHDDVHAPSLSRRAGVGQLIKGKGSRPTSPTGKPKLTETVLKNDVKNGKQKSIDDKEAKLAEKAERKKALEAQIEAKKNQAKQPVKTETVWIRDATEAEINRFLNGEPWYSKDAKKKKATPYLGPDGKGLVDLAEVTKAFENCMEDDKYLFWSAGGSDIFKDNAVARYEEITGRLQVNKAVMTDKCRAQKLGSLRRSSLPKSFIDWKKIGVQKQVKDEDKDASKGKAGASSSKASPTKKVVQWDPAAEKKAKEDVDWAYGTIMSKAYAQAASGEVHYLRPDRAQGESEDFPTTTWARVELPALKASKRQKGVWEVTMKKSNNAADYKTMDITQGSKRQRV